MSDMLLCFSCCCTEPAAAPIRTRRKIDRSMIGTPQNFVHTAHIGSGDMTTAQNSHISSIQTQMSSKGGYEPNGTSPVQFERKVIDVQRTDTEE
ncbi:CDC42 small effector protein 2-A [Holothuria leucospilota]|uniref:CDC42 small effector protein 2-A n=1 Tax=Holothuria leucospilota TaxID=206669 RepID=A0A9Q1H7Q4_HOLLE|nr:CDC42 small effector protein 2-A [Holothuria leucospilota]